MAPIPEVLQAWPGLLVTGARGATQSNALGTQELFLVYLTTSVLPQRFPGMQILVLIFGTKGLTGQFAKKASQQKSVNREFGSITYHTYTFLAADTATEEPLITTQSHDEWMQPYQVMTHPT